MLTSSNQTFYFLFGLLVLSISLILKFKINTQKSKKITIENQEPLSSNEENDSSKSLSTSPAIKGEKEEEEEEEEDNENNNKLIVTYTTTENEKKKKIQCADPSKEIVLPEKEEQSNEKHIGYNPINIFEQSEPYNYPYVIMPKENSIIKFPRKGRVGRKGFKEESFKNFIEIYFKNSFQVYDDRFILTKNSTKPFEPDFTLIDEKNGINIFLDIEIDEPYEGINDISKRKVSHFQHSDTNRNNAFKNRGWIVIRFAEIQVHQEPNNCCLFVADVIKSINPAFVIPENLINIKPILPIKQWSKEEAEVWSAQKYREKYLGIDHFGNTAESQFLDSVEETELGNKIEEQVLEEKDLNPPPINKSLTINELIEKAIISKKYLSFNFQGNSFITKPLSKTSRNLTAYCFIKNKEVSYDINQLSNLILKTNYYTFRVAGPSIGLEQITNAVKNSIKYKKHVRMKYTRTGWTNMFVDKETGELLLNRIDAEESIRTINNVQLAIEVLSQDQINTYNLNSNYITAYCNKREEQRTFRFDRIGEIEILDL